ncbi:MAG: sugar ABC transporter permease, partial [Pseudomonadota bacterium]
MATQHSRTAARVMMAPAVFLLLVWMLVPLAMTLWFSTRQFLPLRGGDLGFVGLDNFSRFVSSNSFWPAVSTTLIIVGGVLAVSIILGTLLALLLDQPIWGQGV